VWGSVAKLAPHIHLSPPSFRGVIPVERETTRGHPFSDWDCSHAGRVIPGFTAADHSTAGTEWLLFLYWLLQRGNESIGLSHGIGGYGVIRKAEF
jgi:hypothetical protein